MTIKRLDSRTLLTAALCALVPVAALAAPMERMLKKLDTDGDGQISMIEFQANDRGMVERIDENDDGAVSQDEVSAHIADHQARMAERMAAMQQHVSERFSTADSNGDGRVTQEEANAAMFSQIDANGDGYLTREEIQAARPERRPGKPGGHLGGQGFGRHNGSQPSDDV